MSDLLAVSEKIGIITAKVDACHRRQDDLERAVISDLQEIKTDLKVLMEHHHVSKGKIAMLILMGNLFGGLVVGIIAKIII